MSGKKKFHILRCKRSNDDEMDNEMEMLGVDCSVDFTMIDENGVNESVLPSAFEKGILSRTPTMSRSRAASMVEFDEIKPGVLLIPKVVSSNKHLRGAHHDDFDCIKSSKKEISPCLLVKNVSTPGYDSIPVVGRDSDDLIERNDICRSISSNWNSSRDINTNLTHFCRSSHAINSDSGTKYTSTDQSARTVIPDSSNVYEHNHQISRRGEAKIRNDDLKKYMGPTEREKVESDPMMRELNEVLDISLRRADHDRKDKVERREWTSSNTIEIQNSDKSTAYRNETINSISGISERTYCIGDDVNGSSNRKSDHLTIGIDNSDFLIPKKKISDCGEIDPKAVENDIYEVRDRRLIDINDIKSIGETYNDNYGKDLFVKGDKNDSDFSSNRSSSNQICSGNNGSNNYNYDYDDNNSSRIDNDDPKSSNYDISVIGISNSNISKNSNKINNAIIKNINRDSDIIYDSKNNCNYNDNTNNNDYYDNNNTNDIFSSDENVSSDKSSHVPEISEIDTFFGTADVKSVQGTELEKLKSEGVSTVFKPCLESLNNRDDLLRVIKKSDVEENVASSEEIICEKSVIFLKGKEIFDDQFIELPSNVEMKMEMEMKVRRSEEHTSELQSRP